MASGREPRVAVVGATGTVGSQIAELIGEREFPYAELKLFGSEAGSAGRVESAGRSFPVARFDSPADLATFDIAFLAVPADRALEIADAHPGPVLIDLSAAGRPPDLAPVVAPGIFSRERVQELKAHRLFATPHPAAQVIARMLAALGEPVTFAGATVILSASAEGRERVSDLFNQTADLLNARLDVDENEAQLAFNLFMPRQSSELAALIAAQVQKLIGAAPDLAVQVVQAPVFHGGAVALSLGLSGDPQERITRLRAAPGLLLIEGDDAAGFVDAIGQEAIIVRLRSSPHGVLAWCVFDSARLAALAGLWIAESLWFTFS